MANEIEVVATNGKGNFSIDQFTSEFEKVKRQFRKVRQWQEILGVEVNGSILKGKAPFDTNGSFGYLRWDDNQKNFAISGPNHQIFDEHYEPIDLINDNIRFSETQLDEICSNVLKSNTSFRITWVSGGEKSKDLLAYLLTLVVANLLEGIVINNYGTSIRSGTYLVKGWLDLIINEF